MKDATEPLRKELATGGTGFTKAGAREAGRRGGLARQKQIRDRAREAAQEAEVARELGLEGAALGSAAGVGPLASISDADAAAIRARLTADAKKGDVAAARELREWQRLDEAQGAGFSARRIAQLVELLTAANRSVLLELVLELLERQRSEDLPAQQHIRQGSDDADQSLPEKESRRVAEGHPAGA